MACVDANKTSTAIEEETGLSKEQKGRYKKLRKRLQNVATNQNVSGFVLINECIEWEDLVCRSPLDSPPLGSPQFLWRRGCVEGRWTEGSHHRDILFALLLPVGMSTSEERSHLKNDEQSSTTSSQATVVSGGKKRSRQVGPCPREEMLKFKSVPAWLSFHNPASVASIAVVELHFLTDDQLQSTLRKIKEHLSLSNRSFLAAPTRWFSGGHQAKCMSDALLFATPKNHRNRAAPVAAKIESLAQIIDSMKTFVLSSDDLEKSCYPLDKGKEGWVSSPKTINTQSKLFALDCEMVETIGGRALARFTLVEAVGYDSAQQKLVTQVALDTFVQPQDTIRDYLTPYSGITAELLSQGPTMDLTELQQFIISHVTQQDILIGHSLENDLQVCQWVHSCCVDTALLFSHSNSSFKYSLRHLSCVLLGREIQQPDRPHCSEEDAKAAMDLAFGKALKGDEFGLKDMRSTNQWRMLSKQENGNSAVAVGPLSWLQKYITCQPNAAHALSCDKCTDPNSKALLSFVTAGKKRRSRLAWAQFHVSSEAEENACVEQLQQLFDKMSLADTVALVSLQCFYEHVVKQEQRRRLLRTPSTTLSWTDADEQALVECLRKSRLGFAIWVGGAKL